MRPRGHHGRVRADRIVRPGLLTRLPAFTPRLATAVALTAGFQLVLALAIARQPPAAAMLALLVAFVLLTVLEPRISFCVPLFYLLLAFDEPGSVSLTDLILLVPPAVLACSLLSGGDFARRAGALLRAHRFKLLVALFGVLVLMGSTKALLADNSDGAFQPLRLALAPVLLLGLAVFRSQRELLSGLRIVFYTFVVYTLGSSFYFIATGGSQTTASEVSTGGTRILSNSSAMYAAVAFILLALHLAQEDRLLRRIGLSALMAASVFSIAIALARTTWAAALIVILALAVLMPEMKRGLARFAIVVAPVALVGALLLPVVAADQLETIQQRVDRPEGPAERDQSAIFRLVVWDQMLDRWEQSPLLGRGFGQEVRYESNDGSTVVVNGDPHNGFIYLLVALGLVGLTAFLFVQVGFIAMTIPAIRGSPIGRELGFWALGTWIIYMANVYTGVMLGSRPFIAFLWILLALPVALAALPEERRDAAPADGPVLRRTLAARRIRLKSS